jgi:hypothetical protein
MALSMRDLQKHLRETGQSRGFNPAFAPRDRSQFLQALEHAIQLSRWLRACWKKYFLSPSKHKLPIWLSSGNICIRGKIEEAFDLLNSASETADQYDERWFEAELHRLKGEWIIS